MKLFISLLVSVALFVSPLFVQAGPSLNGNRLGCTPYLGTLSVGEPVTVTVSDRNIPKSKVNEVTWVVPYYGSPSSGTGLTFTTAFTGTGLLTIHMYYKGEFSGVCAFNVQ